MIFLWVVKNGDGRIVSSTVRPTKSQVIDAMVGAQYGRTTRWRRFKRSGCAIVRVSVQEYPAV